MSLVTFLFPFINYGIIILGSWRIAYAFWQFKQADIKPLKFIATRLIIIALLWIIAIKGGIFIYLATSFIKAVIKSTLKKKVARIVWRPQIVRLIHAVAGIILLPIIIHSYVLYFQRDDLDRLRYYVYPGTAQSRALGLKIARDKNLDLTRVEQMLKSTDDEEAYKAYELLYHRRSFADLLYFQDIILSLPAAEYDLDTNDSPRSDPYLPLWLGALGAENIKTKEDLKKWIEEQKKIPAKIP